MKGVPKKVKKYLGVGAVVGGLIGAPVVGYKAVELGKEYRRVSAPIVQKNSSRSSEEAPYVNPSIRFGGFLNPRNTNFLDSKKAVFDSNVGGNCSAYAVRIAKKYFNKNFVKADAWDLMKKNKATFFKPVNLNEKKFGLTKKNIELLIEKKEITPGSIIGVYFPQSTFLVESRPFTHVIVYVGKINGEHVFWHNFGGPRKITLEELFGEVGGKRVFYPTVVINPK